MVMRLVTRAQLGWPVSSAPLQATTKGVKVHYTGSAVSTALLKDHSLCLALWQDIREAHLANVQENYSDVAYNYAACVHGYVLEGRGIGRRTGANGSQTLNKAHYAVLGLIGNSGVTEPTDELLNAIRDATEHLQTHGAGTEIKGHKDGHATSCPGGPLYAWVQKGAPRPTTEEDDMPTTAEIADAVARKLIAGGGVLENSDVDRIAKAVAARPATLTDAQVQALATNPTLAEAIAEKVAAKLAARLAN
ncbi:hypothetical protein GCM10023084_05670 [Streptomyces lacrimifluminis]|uniref:N-acetylmuramoyl-L-alanine amidase n=1 Tax=Streptomyces lacrimifluminis TaxID=1500077 RepID=A0A917KRG8_9ACTN|nr:peptidoglycan recognition family protein [Streptomyces lacrimifluminis]GGJ23018.1 hypothetical protein GCM10012282_19410 [Streptomyces lacrimifluminis]